MQDSCDWKRLVYVPGTEPPPAFNLQAKCLQRDVTPCLYLYRQIFFCAHIDRLAERVGVMGVLRTGGQDGVLPHEQTFAAGVAACQAERALLRAETSSLSLWCEDPGNEVHQLLRACGYHTFRSYQDRFGCTHELTRITDPELISRLQAHLRTQTLYLADGHHRFAAGWTLATVQLRSDTLRPHPGAHAQALADLEVAARNRILLAPKSTDFQPKLAGRLLWHEI